MVQALWIIFFLTATVVAWAPCRAQTGEAPRQPLLQRELIVGTKEAPPFAMKNSDGSWGGISIELWRRMADGMHLQYRFAEVATVQQLIDGVAKQEFDVAIAALTASATRARIVDFTQSFYATGLGIAVPAGGAASWGPVVQALTSAGFAQAVLGLIGLALVVGLLIWALEHRHNEDFGGGVTKGLGSSMLWATAAMTQRGLGNLGPRTLLGRMVAMLWMVGSIIAIAVFTAGITAALTVRQLQGTVHSVTDLSTVRVGATSGTSTEEGLSRYKISYRKFDTPQNGLKALRAGQIDAFVYDKPLLAWIVHQEFRSSVQVLDVTFDTQVYAFALPNGSPLRKPLDVAVLDAVHTAWWDEILFRYLGDR